jgi:hypothetical protein
MSDSSGQVPVIISTGLICLALGAGLTFVTMFFIGFKIPDEQPSPEEVQAEALAMMNKSGVDAKSVISGGKMSGKSGPPAGAKGMGGLGAPGANTRGGAAKKGGGFAPTSKAQLALLVAKLDALTAKPLSVDLNDDQRAKVREQLKGLVGEDDLSEDDAKERLDKLLETLQPHKTVLEQAGFLWPGSGPPTRGGNVDNPFKEGAGADHVKNLEKRLEKSK